MALKKSIIAERSPSDTAIKMKFLALKEENKRLRKQIQQMKLVNQAKWVLVEHCHMTENQAHKYIENQAMNKRISKTTVATNILHTKTSIDINCLQTC